MQKNNHRYKHDKIIILEFKLVICEALIWVVA